MVHPYRRIYRSRDETQLTGLCGGIGLYFQVDPVLIRLLWVIATLMTGIVPGALAYLIGWLIVPLEPLTIPHANAQTAQQAPPAGS
jgi:phage shock protein C